MAFLERVSKIVWPPHIKYICVRQGESPGNKAEAHEGKSYVT